MQVRFRAGSPNEPASLAKGLVVAIDLGFAKTSSSCGIAWSNPSAEEPLGDDAKQFGKCIVKAVELVHPYKLAALILEAPLSGLFSATGNPIERGAFERQTTGKQSQVRYWYSGPGAATCLAAVFFCRELRNKLESMADLNHDITIVLFEGFISFKKKAKPSKKSPTPAKQKKPTHREEAKYLRDTFLSGNPTKVQVEPKDGQQIIAITDVLSGAKGGEIPPIIVLPVLKSRRTKR